MPVALTYEAYPNILDAIVAESDFATELALRLVCRPFRGAVDRKQVRHIVLTPNGSDAISIRGPVQRIAVLRRLGPKSIAQLPEHPVLALLRHVRVVDVRGFFPPTCDLSLLKDALPKLGTVRLCTDQGTYTPYIPFGAETLVLFTSPYGLDCEARARSGRRADVEATFAPPSITTTRPDQDLRPVPPGVEWAALPTNVRRVVINLGGEDYPAADLWPLLIRLPTQVSELVVVMPCIRSLPLWNTGYAPAPISSTVFNSEIVAYDLVELLNGAPRTVTLVGVDLAEPPSKFSKILRATLSDIQLAGVEYHETDSNLDTGGGARARAVSTAAHDAKVDEIMRQVNMLSWTEYVFTGVPRKAMTETVEYADGTKRKGGRPLNLPGDLRRKLLEGQDLSVTTFSPPIDSAL